MLVFDQLKKSDPQLQLLAALLCAGLVVLLAGLWWVQVVNARNYQSHLETQSVRSVRIPPVRGKILDRTGQVLAENRVSFNISIYLEDLSDSFKQEYKKLRQPRIAPGKNISFWKRLFKVDAKPKPAKLNGEQIEALKWQARHQVVGRVIQQIRDRLQIPDLRFDTNGFNRHFIASPYLPYPVMKNVSYTNLARFEEQLSGGIAASLEIQSTRYYPQSNIASHVLGYLIRDNSSRIGEEAVFSYSLPDYRGVVGIEGKFETNLHGRASAKYVRINNLGYHQSETIADPGQPGRAVVLTLDLNVQREAERALAAAVGPAGKGAAVVMDVDSGDVLALVSLPSSDPNYFIQGFTPEKRRRWDDNDLGVQKNRATAEVYQAGSTFKTIVALAALEKGLNKDYTLVTEADTVAGRGSAYYVGKQRFHDVVPPGPYNLKRAIVRSSNSYFIDIGLRPGVFDRVVELAGKLHLGETMGLPLLQEAAGHFPKPERIRSRWPAGETANICIGGGAMDATPMQMTVVAATLANGGTILKPRLVERIEATDPMSLEPATVFPRHQVRGQLGVKKEYLQILCEAMMEETEGAEGTGKGARVEGLRICGKTGTAERKEGGRTRNTTWFFSFAPYERPRYAVVIMVENGVSGGVTCAPVARPIYQALLKTDSNSGPKTLAASTR